MPINSCPLMQEDAQPGDPGFDKWRRLDMEQAQALTSTPNWAALQDEFGRNAVMNALYCFSPPEVVRFLLTEALHQGALAQLCQAEDFCGVRLPAYALREGLRGLAHGEPWSKALFEQGVCNAKGQGLLAQLELRRSVDSIDPKAGPFLLRGVGFDFAHLAHLSPHDWQAGLDEDDFLRYWSQQVLVNEAPGGVAFTNDFEAFRAWVLPLYCSTPKQQWIPTLAHCFDVMETAEKLLDLGEGQCRLAEALLQEALPGLRLLLTHTPHKNRSLVPYILYYHGFGALWEGLLACEQAKLLALDLPDAPSQASARRV